MDADKKPEIRRLDYVEPRVETGPVQFGDDWPGVFIRGDNAFFYCMALRRAVSQLGDRDLDGLMLKGLADLLSSSDLTGISRSSFGSSSGEG